jgi:predicted RNase H-like HicB family nuclease
MNFTLNVSSDIVVPMIQIVDNAYVATLPVRIRWSEADQVYIGTFHTLGDCCHADTEQEVLQQLISIAETWFLTSLKKTMTKKEVVSTEVGQPPASLPPNSG